MGVKMTDTANASENPGVETTEPDTDPAASSRIRDHKTVSPTVIPAAIFSGEPSHSCPKAEAQEVLWPNSPRQSTMRLRRPIRQAAERSCQLLKELIKQDAV